LENASKAQEVKEAELLAQRDKLKSELAKVEAQLEELKQTKAKANKVSDFFIVSFM
jgi:hypothetical protein